MVRLTVFLFCMLLPFFWVEAERVDDDPIVVQLETESRLLPLYLNPLIDDHSGFSKEYLKQLESVLAFDFNHNGATFIVKSNAQQNTFNSFDDLGEIALWRSQKIYFVLKVRIKDKELSARLLAVLTSKGKSIDGLKLTGNLAQDRRTIHQLADGIHKALFGEDGVASTKILYTTKLPGTQKNTDWNSHVWEMDYDGANARRVSSDDAGYCVTPIYVPPKEGFACGSFVYISYKTGQPKIYVASLKDGVGRRYSLLKGNQLMPALSPQRDKIAFICDITGNPDLFIQDFSPETGAKDRPRQVYATYKATQGSPSFSPNGKQIAFVSNKDGSPRIYVMEIPPIGMKLKDIKATLLSRYSKENTAPAWSPDGTKIAYCAMTDGVRQIWMYDFDKKEERQLTRGQMHKENPSWAPNSIHLVYNTNNASGNNDLYMININQHDVVKISSGAGDKRFPNWEPR